MAELFGTMLRIMIFLLALGSASAKRFSIMAPNVLHIGVEENVSVTVFDAPQSVTVKLYLEDYPNRQNTFSQVQTVLQPQKGANAFLTVRVEPKDLPDTNSVDKQYVYLVAKSDDAHFKFHREAKILLSYRDGIVFIQTDKPIYTPRQTVKIRVIPLKFDTTPSKRKITVIIMNPQGIRVEQWKNLNTSTGIIRKELQLNNFIIKGNWTITALYGHKNIHNTTVQFEVKEYVLPKFSVAASVPPYILRTDEVIKVTITATYTYGKPVVGAANIRLKIVESNGLVVPFPPIPPMLLRSGKAVVEEKVEVIRDLLRAFPEKGRRRLHVQAEVIERATGNKETVVDNSCLFTSSPYLVEFKNTLKYFKPGLPFVVKVVVTYPNKQPAKSVPVKISATGHGIQENEKKDLKPNGKTSSEDKTNEMGEAEFAVDSCAECQTITIKVETNDKELQDSQNTAANYLMEAFNSGSGPLIKVRQLEPPGKIATVY